HRRRAQPEHRLLPLRRRRGRQQLHAAGPQPRHDRHDHLGERRAQRQRNAPHRVDHDLRQFHRPHPLHHRPDTPPHPCPPLRPTQRALNRAPTGTTPPANVALNVSETLRTESITTSDNSTGATHFTTGETRDHTLASTWTADGINYAWNNGLVKLSFRNSAIGDLGYCQAAGSLLRAGIPVADLQLVNTGTNLLVILKSGNATIAPDRF